MGKDTDVDAAGLPPEGGEEGAAHDAGAAAVAAAAKAASSAMPTARLLVLRFKGEEDG